MLTTSVGLALVLAGPGLAADELVPLVEIAPPPDIATSEPFVAPPDPTLPPAPESASSEPTATEPPITVSVNADGGDIDVSVRVLSPGKDAGEGTEPPLISDAEEPDITAAPAPASDPPDSTTGDDTGDESNTNVRVLSPGDNGPVGQGNPLGAGEAETPDTSREDAVEAATESTMPPKDGEQYQELNSRYQSSDQFESDAWIWLWYLSLDCGGNPTSSSTEEGRPSSGDWRWEWTWEWDCGSPPHPPPVDSLEPAIDTDATRGAAEPTEREPASTAPTGGATSGDDAAPEPWLWTWTFTFCGETVTATLPINAQTALVWTWKWMWTWTCRDEAAPGSSETTPDPPAHHPSPTPVTEAAGPAPNAPSAGTPGADMGHVGDVQPSVPWVIPVDLPAWVISLLAFPEFGRSAIKLVPVFDPLTRAAVISTLADIAPIPLPFVVPAAPLRAADAPAAFDTLVISPRGPQSGEGAALTPATTVPVGTDSSPSRGGEAHSAEPRLEKASPRAKRHSAGRHPRGDPPLTPWPPLRPLQAAGAPGASSSFVPSTSVLGTAALVALFVLAAPGFGRRVRAARALRPRGTFGSSIDRPG